MRGVLFEWGFSADAVDGDAVGVPVDWPARIGANAARTKLTSAGATVPRRTVDPFDNRTRMRVPLSFPS
ncbi:hypothetical protein C6369_001350 [Rhodococcus rhodochrous]|nr:hypothetical protein C6369_001350 [Rhodococcus rhodochrous]